MLLATALPSVVPLVAGGDVVIEGAYFYAHDVPQFLAAINQGRVEGHWLLTNRFTAEPHSPAFIYPFYLALGHVGALLGATDDNAIFLWSLLAGRLALCAVVVALVERTLPVESRGWAYLLLGTMGAFAVSVGAAFLQLWVTPEPNRFLPPAPTVLTIMMATPHATVGLTVLLAMVLLWSDDAWPAEPLRLAGVAGGTAALGVIYPFLVPVALTLALAGAGLQFWRRRELAPLVRAALVAGATASPFALYNLLLFYGDPFWRDVYGPTQNAMPSPPLWYLPIYFGVAGIPAAWLLASGWRRCGPALTMAGLAALCLLVWMYLPVSFQRRTDLSAHTLLAILAAAALGSGWLAARPRLRATWISVGLVDTALVLGLILASSLGQGPWPIRSLPSAEVELATWLGQRVARDEVVLAPTNFSAFLASRSPGRVASADAGTSTRNFAVKRTWVEAYFAPETTAAERAVLEEWLGSPSWLVAPIDHVPAPSWEPRRVQGALAVYQRSPRR